MNDSKTQLKVECLRIAALDCGHGSKTTYLVHLLIGDAWITKAAVFLELNVDLSSGNSAIGNNRIEFMVDFVVGTFGKDDPESLILTAAKYDPQNGWWCCPKEYLEARFIQYSSWVGSWRHLEELDEAGINSKEVKRIAMALSIDRRIPWGIPPCNDAMLV